MSINALYKLLQHLWHRYGTLNNVVVAIALVIAAGWAWGSVTMMQRNFALQKQYDARKRDMELTSLQVATLEYQRNYYKSDEYKELAAREQFGVAAPGEKVLQLPPNTVQAKKYDTNAQIQSNPDSRVKEGSAASNFQQWMDFLLGNTAKRLQ